MVDARTAHGHGLSWSWPWWCPMVIEVGYYMDLGLDCGALVCGRCVMYIAGVLRVRELWEGVLFILGGRVYYFAYISCVDGGGELSRCRNTPTTQRMVRCPQILEFYVGLFGGATTSQLLLLLCIRNWLRRVGLRTATGTALV